MLAGHTYTVEAGDYLSKIAPVYGESWQKLYADNRSVIGNDPDLIFPGQVLTVGGKTVKLLPVAPKSEGDTQPPVHHTPHRSSGGSVGGSPSSLAGIFGSQASCASAIVERESGWNVHAENPYSGAYGLPQALPGSKMASAGADWRDNPATQLRWMRSYVDSVYGGACAAWAFWQVHSFY